MEGEVNVHNVVAGDWVLVGGKITKASKALITSNPADIRDIELTPDILQGLDFWTPIRPCSDGTYNYIMESEYGSRLICNLEERMIRLEDVLFNKACSVRLLQRIIKEYYRRFPPDRGEFTFLVRRINKYFTKMAK